MEISEDGIALVRQSEGLRLAAYQDAGGKWTVGYGHTGHDVYDGLVITEAEAEELLHNDLLSSQLYVNFLVKAPLTQGMFDALVDWTFNLGLKRLKQSTMLKLLNEGNYAGAKAELLKWDRVGEVVVEGLLHRRQAEAKLWDSADVTAR